MIRKCIVSGSLMILAAVCASILSGGMPLGAAYAEKQASGKGMASLQTAKEAKKYLFVFFYEKEDEKTVQMRKAFDKGTQALSPKADVIAINRSDPDEKALVDKYEIGRAPMPLVLAIAPNGAITRGFQNTFTEAQLVEAIVSPCMQDCLKALQSGKLVFVCAQNAETKSNDEAMKGVREFKREEQFSKMTEIIMLDPADKEETNFKTQLRIADGAGEAVTVLLAPPGQSIATFKGSTDKDAILAALQKASSACGPGGCGPSGCGP